MSSGSPSAPLVEGIMPKSHGKLVPSGRIILNGNVPNDPENAYVFGLPFGVSTTWTWSSSPKVARRLREGLNKGGLRHGVRVEPWIG